MVMTGGASRHALQVIRRELKKQGMSQRQLALKAGIAPSNLSRVMNGKSIPTISYLGNLAHALGKNLSISFVSPTPSE
jgi:transcriptional regulator with XRE-family HTH domain